MYEVFIYWWVGFNSHTQANKNMAQSALSAWRFFLKWSVRLSTSKLLMLRKRRVLSNSFCYVTTSEVIS